MKQVTSRLLALGALYALPLAASAALTDNLEVVYTFDAGQVLFGRYVKNYREWNYHEAANNANLTLTTVSGKFGNALRTLNDSNGASDATPYGADTNPLFQPHLRSWSLSFWARSSAVSRRLCHKGGRADDANNAPGWQIWVLADGKLEFALSKDNASAREKITTAHAGTWDGTTWNHVALTVNRISATQYSYKGYLNGVATSSGTITVAANQVIGTNSGTWFREFRVGTAGSGGTVDLDDLGIWTRELTGAEIAYLYDGAAGRALNTALTFTAAQTLRRSLECTYTFDAGQILSGRYVKNYYEWGQHESDNAVNDTITTTAGKFGSAIRTTATYAAAGGTPRGTDSDAVYQPGQGSWTLTCWARASSVSRRLINKGGRYDDANQAPGWGVYVLADGRVEFAMSPSTYAVRNKVTTPGARGTWNGTAWNHIALTVTRTSSTACTFTGYVNGEAFGSGSLAVPAAASLGTGAGTWYRELHLGTHDSGATVDLDDVSFWSRDLAAGEIGYLYNGGTGRVMDDHVLLPNAIVESFTDVPVDLCDLNARALGAGFAMPWSAPDSSQHLRAYASLHTLPIGVVLAPAGGHFESSSGLYQQKVSTRALAGDYRVDLRKDRNYFVSFTGRKFNNDSFGTLSLHRSADGACGVDFGWRWNNAGASYCRLGGALTGAGGSPFNGPENYRGAMLDNTVYFFVVKIAAVASGTDRAYLKVFASGNTVPDCELYFSGEGDGVNQWTVISSGADSNLLLDQLRINIGQPASGYGQLDEIRIGTSWRDVTGQYPKQGSAFLVK